MQCTAHSKRDGSPCRGKAVKGRTTCRMHGGTIPRGLALPQTTHGRYSKDLPARLAGRYREAQSDPELLALRDEVALVDARLGDVLGRVDSGESGALWKQLSNSWQAFIKARRRGYHPAHNKCLRRNRCVQA